MTCPFTAESDDLVAVRYAEIFECLVEIGPFQKGKAGSTLT